MTAPVDRAAMAARYTVANYAEWDTEKRNEYGGGFLLRPDGTDLAMLGEHEDCTWVRDGAPVVEELNRLLADVERLTAERHALAEAVIEVMTLMDTARTLHRPVGGDDLGGWADMLDAAMPVVRPAAPGTEGGDDVSPV